MTKTKYLLLEIHPKGSTQGYTMQGYHYFYGNFVTSEFSHPHQDSAALRDAVRKLEDGATIIDMRGVSPEERDINLVEMPLPRVILKEDQLYSPTKATQEMEDAFEDASEFVRTLRRTARERDQGKRKYTSFCKLTVESYRDLCKEMGMRVGTFSEGHIYWEEEGFEAVEEMR